MSSFRPTDPALTPYGVNLEGPYSVPIPPSTAREKAREDLSDKTESIFDAARTGQFNDDDVRNMRQYAYGDGLKGSGKAVDMYMKPSQARLDSMSSYTLPIEEVTLTAKHGKPHQEDIWPKGQLTVTNLGQRADGTTSIFLHERVPGSGISGINAYLLATDTGTVTASRQLGEVPLPIPGRATSVGDVCSATSDIPRKARRFYENALIETFGPSCSDDETRRHGE